MKAVKSRARRWTQGVLALGVGLNTWTVSAQENTAATPLPEVDVVGEHESGYAVRRSSTATKTDSLLRDVPQSVTVVTRDAVLDQGAQNLGDVMRYVPGVGMAQGEGNRETPILRGNSTTSDFFVDGIRDDVQYYRDLYNIERVEVLKGPNAMIFGRGGVGGVINRVTRQANGSRVRELLLQAGSYDNKRLTFDLGDAVSERQSLRLTGLYEDGDSYRDGVFIKRYGANPTLSLRAGERTTVTLGYEYFKDERIADRGFPSFQGRPYALLDHSVFVGDPGNSPTDTEVNTFTAVVEHQLGDGLKLTNRTLYGDYDKFYQNVYASSAVTFDATDQRDEVQLAAYNNLTLRENFFSQTDFTYTLNAGAVAHTLLAGLEVGRQDTDNLRLTGYFDAAFTQENLTVAATSPTISAPLFFRPKASDGDNNGVAEILALYVQDQMVFSPAFQAVFGLRYDRFDMDFHDTRSGGDVRVTHTDDLLSPRVGLIYKPAEPLSLYASYTLTYLPRSGEQLSSMTPANRTLDPERFTNYELGAKWDWSPELALTAAVYELERSNVAIADPNNAGQFLLVDGQRTRGLELGLSGNVTTAWSIAGGFAYQQGEITRTQSATVQQGATLAQLPRNTISLWNRYAFNSAWAAGLGVYKRSDMFTSTDNTVRLDGYTRLDAALYWTVNENLQAQLNVENLLDEDYFANAHNNNNITPGGPAAVRALLRLQL